MCPNSGNLNSKIQSACQCLFGPAAPRLGWVSARCWRISWLLLACHVWDQVPATRSFLKAIRSNLKLQWYGSTHMTAKLVEHGLNLRIPQKLDCIRKAIVVQTSFWTMDHPWSFIPKMVNFHFGRPKKLTPPTSRFLSKTQGKTTPFGDLGGSNLIGGQSQAKWKIATPKCSSAKCQIPLILCLPYSHGFLCYKSPLKFRIADHWN